MITNNQQPSIIRNDYEGSETILKESKELITPEAVSILTGKAEDNNIVQNLRSLAKRKSKEQYLEKIRAKYGNKFTFDFTNWSGITGNKIKITCPLHGEFEQVPRVLLLSACKTGCKQCGLEKKNSSKTKNFQDFVAKANRVHNNKYGYINDNYKNRRTRVRIICKEHGEFIKSAQKHLSGQGCWECKIQQLVKDNILVGGYCKQLFTDNPTLKDKKAYLYYFSINGGRLYKIGISTNFKDRVKGLKNKSKGFIKSIEVVWIKEDTLYNCFLKEQEILNKYSNQRTYFKWSTELFKSNILPQLN